MIDESTWLRSGGDARRMVLGVSLHQGPSALRRRLMVEFRADSGARLYIDDVADRSTVEVEPSTIACVNDGIVAYFPPDSLDGLCSDRPIESVYATGGLILFG